MTTTTVSSRILNRGDVVPSDQSIDASSARLRSTFAASAVRTSCASPSVTPRRLEQIAHGRALVQVRPLLGDQHQQRERVGEVDLGQVARLGQRERDVARRKRPLEAGVGRAGCSHERMFARLSRTCLYQAVVAAR